MKTTVLFVFALMMGVSVIAQPLTPQEVWIPMRDGDSLAADLYVPQPEQPRPTILVQTPYNKYFYRYNLPVGYGTDVDACPYNVVVMDWRGFYASADAANPDATRGEDGYDAIDWIKDQAWSDGNIGTWGASALGKVQFMTAAEQHPNHICAVPLVASPEYNYQVYYPNGVYREEYVEQLDALGFGISTWIEPHPYHDWLWMYVEDSTYAPGDIHIPMLMIGGWYDHATEWLLRYFEGIRTQSPDSIAEQHKLMMGPWAHNTVGKLSQGELEFPAAQHVSEQYAQAFFDYHLLHAYNGWPSNPGIKYFQMGDMAWHETETWPPTGFSDEVFYLHADGSLNPNTPASGDSCTTVSYDPRDPSPTIGGPTLHADLQQGPYDQAPEVESRDDIVIFDSGELAEPVSMAGKPRVVLFVSSNRTDTDFAVRLTDVYPDGRSMILADGIYRMRFRNGYTSAAESFITPGEIYQIEMEFPDIAQTFPAGHHIRLDITSSNYPRFHRNINDGGDLYAGGDTLTALNKVYHNDGQQSKLILPVEDAVYVPATTKKSLELYPNPMAENDKLCIHGAAGRTLSIINSTGKLVFNTTIKSPKHTVAPGLSPGLYLVKIKGHGGRQVEKLIVY